MMWAIAENTNPISKEHFQALIAATPIDKAILEFGSGYATAEMVKWRKVISIEHNKEWCDKYHDNYLYVPIGKNIAFYDYAILTVALKACKGTYGSVLIDGPDHDIRMVRLLHYLTYNPDVLDTTVPWFFDDSEWPPFRDALYSIAELRQTELFHFEITAKCWAVIPAGRKKND